MIKIYLFIALMLASAWGYSGTMEEFLKVVPEGKYNCLVLHQNAPVMNVYKDMEKVSVEITRNQETVSYTITDEDTYQSNGSWLFRTRRQADQLSVGQGAGVRAVSISAIPAGSFPLGYNKMFS